MDATPAQLAEALRAQLQLVPGESLYGIVDGAQDLELAYEAKCLYGQKIRSLFEGEIAPAVAEVAPYVVPIDPASGYLENWGRRCGSNAGILVTTAVDPDTFYGHVRAIFIAEDEQGQHYFFRFYDPRVLRDYLPTCTLGEIRSFFGPISSFLMDGPEPRTLLRFTAECQRMPAQPTLLSVP